MQSVQDNGDMASQEQYNQQRAVRRLLKRKEQTFKVKVIFLVVLKDTKLRKVCF